MKQLPKYLRMPNREARCESPNSKSQGQATLVSRPDGGLARVHHTKPRETQEKHESQKWLKSIKQKMIGSPKEGMKKIDRSRNGVQRGREEKEARRRKSEDGCNLGTGAEHGPNTSVVALSLHQLVNHQEWHCRRKLSTSVRPVSYLDVDQTTKKKGANRNLQKSDTSYLDVDQTTKKNGANRNSSKVGRLH